MKAQYKPGWWVAEPDWKDFSGMIYLQKTGEVMNPNDLPKYPPTFRSFPRRTRWFGGLNDEKYKAWAVICFDGRRWLKESRISLQSWLRDTSNRDEFPQPINCDLSRDGWYRAWWHDGNWIPDGYLVPVTAIKPEIHLDPYEKVLLGYRGQWYEWHPTLVEVLRSRLIDRVDVPMIFVYQGKECSTSTIETAIVDELATCSFFTQDGSFFILELQEDGWHVISQDKPKEESDE